MPNQYLLPCQCGAAIPVDVAQAGQSIACSCGKVLSVPTFRELSKLQRVEGGSRAENAPRWSALQGLVFAGGLLVTVALLSGAGYYTAIRATLAVKAPPPPTDGNAWSDTYLSATPPEEVLKLWNIMQSQGLGPWQPPPHVVNQEQAAEMLFRIKVFLAAAAVAACVAASSFWLPKGQA